MREPVRTIEKKPAHKPFSDAIKLLEKYPMLRGTPAFEDPLDIARWLSDTRRDFHMTYFRMDHKAGKMREEYYSLSYLAKALVDGGIISIKRKEELRGAAEAGDYYLNHLRSSPTFTSLQKVLTWMMENAPDLPKTVKKKTPSWVYLMQALAFGRKIPADLCTNWQVIAPPAEYAFSKKELLCDILPASIAGFYEHKNRSWCSGVYHYGLPYKNNPHKLLQHRYINYVCQASIYLFENLIRAATEEKSNLKINVELADRTLVAHLDIAYRAAPLHLVYDANPVSELHTRTA